MYVKEVELSVIQVSHRTVHPSVFLTLAGFSLSLSLLHFRFHLSTYVTCIAHKLANPVVNVFVPIVQVWVQHRGGAAVSRVCYPFTLVFTGKWDSHVEC